MRLAIAGIILSMFDRLNNGHTTTFDVKTELVTISVPDLGPKSFDIASDDIDDFVYVINNFDPGSLTMSEVVEKTLEKVEIGKDENKRTIYRFRTSLEKGARSVVVAEEDWADFVRFWEAAKNATPSIVEAYQKRVAEANAAANPEKAAAEKAAAEKADDESGEEPTE